MLYGAEFHSCSPSGTPGPRGRVFPHFVQKANPRLGVLGYLGCQVQSPRPGLSGCVQQPQEA